MKNLKLLLIVSLLLATSFLHAKDSASEARINELFEELSYVKANYDPTGAVCEKVAEIEIKALYPETDYQIINGIEYHNKIEAIGELDLIIFDKKTDLVDNVIEVKCWKSYKGGLRKAHEQKTRFQANLKNDIRILDKNGKTYPKAKFLNIREFKTMSQLGGVQEGFDYELSLDLKSLMKLRDKLLDCYAHKRCPRVR